MKFFDNVFAVATIVSVFASPIKSRSSTKLTQAQVESRLKAYGITASSSGGCTTRNVFTCTSYEKINSGTIDAVITLKNASGATLVITNGTEVDHAGGTYSHYSGYKVDIRHTTVLNNYIKTSFTKLSTRSYGYLRWQAVSGNIYCVWEKNVLYKFLR